MSMSMNSETLEDRCMDHPAVGMGVTGRWVSGDSILLVGARCGCADGATTKWLQNAGIMYKT